MKFEVLISLSTDVMPEQRVWTRLPASEAELSELVPGYDLSCASTPAEVLDARTDEDNDMRSLMSTIVNSYDVFGTTTLRNVNDLFSLIDTHPSMARLADAIISGVLADKQIEPRTLLEVSNLILSSVKVPYFSYALISHRGNTFDTTAEALGYTHAAQNEWFLDLCEAGFDCYFDLDAYGSDLIENEGYIVGRNGYIKSRDGLDYDTYDWDEVRKRVESKKMQAGRMFRRS